MEAKSGSLQHGICSSPLLPPFLQPLSKALHENTKYHDDRRQLAGRGVGGGGKQRIICLLALAHVIY